MILCFCFTNRLTRLLTLTVPHPSPHLAPPVKGESLVCVQRSLPGALFCLPHQIFIVSLCLSEIITASSMIGHTVMDVWCFCFRGFLLYLCIIHHHTTTLLKESGLKLLFLKKKIIRSAVPGLRTELRHAHVLCF